MIDKKQKLILLIGILAIIASVIFTLTDRKSEAIPDYSQSDIEALICSIDGINEAKVIVYKDGENIGGIAVIYSGDSSARTKNKIYELISSLYGITYSRIFVGN